MLLAILSLLLLLVALLVFVGVPLAVHIPESFTVVKEGGCDVRVASTYNRIEEGSEIRVIQHRIFNAGQSCVVKSDQLDPKGPFTIGAGETVSRERLAQFRPKLVQTEVFVGATNTTLKKTLIPLYAEP